MNNSYEPFPLDQDVVRRDPAHPPAPETLETPPELLPIEHGSTIIRIRLLIATALLEGTWTEQQGIEAKRWLDSASSL